MANPTGAGKYSKIIRGLYETIATIEAVTSRALAEKNDEISQLKEQLKSVGAAPIELTAPQVPEGISEEDTAERRAALSRS